MVNFPRSFFCRFVASFLAFVLIQTAPGMGVYQAVAQMRGTSAAATGSAPTGAPVRIEMSMPGANAIMTPNAGLGLTSSLLSAPSAAPTPNTPSVVVPTANTPMPSAAVNASLPAAAGLPLSFKPYAVPAAAKAVAVNAAGSVVPAALAPNSSAASALVETGAAITKVSATKTPVSEPSALMGTLRSFFDGSSSYKGTLSGPAAASVGDARPSVPSALAPSDLSAAATPDAQPPVPPSNDAPKAPRRAPVSVGLTLAVLGGGAAWYTSAWAVSVIGGLIAPFVAVPAAALSIAWITAGTLAGFAAFSVETWTGFPKDLKDSAVSAGGMTFRFWARFGLIFDAVLRGKSADMTAPTPANIFKYPVIAWLFVVAGYVMSPVAFVLGAAYRLVGTPFLAAFRGAREVIVGFLPWMARVFRFLGRFIMRIFPFVGGFIVGGVKTALLGAAAGAVLLAGPIGRDAFETEYKPSSLPGWIAHRLTQLAAIAAILVTGAVGAVVGLISSPVHVVMGALNLAFDWSGVNDAAEEFFSRWMRSVKNDGAFNALGERGFPLAKDNLSLAARLTRVLNGTAIALYTALVVPFVSIATIVRATAAAFKGTDVKRSASPSRSTDETGTSAPVAPRAGFALPAILGSIGLVGGLAAGVVLVGMSGLIMPIGFAAVSAFLAVVAVFGVLGAGLGLALSQPQAWSGWLSDIVSEGSLSAKQAMGGWLDVGGRTTAALRGDAAPRESESVVALAIPAALGAIAAAASGVLGGLHGAVAKPVIAAWTGFMAVITQFLPFLKRFLNWAVEVLKNIVPFVFGFVFGTIWGVLKAGWYVSTNLFRPVEEIFEREDSLRSKPSGAQISAGVLMGLTLVVPALAVFAGAFVAGAIVGVPVALTHGLALGVRWAGTGENSERYFRTWERRSLPNELRRAREVVEIKLGSEGAEMPIWRVYVRVSSFLLAAIPSAIALLISGAAAYVRSLADAKLTESKPEARPSAPDEPVPAPNTEQQPAGKPPVWLAAALGATGLAAGLYAGVQVALFSLPMATGWLAYTAVLAGIPLLGLSTGLAVSQPVLWKRLVPNAIENAAGGFGRSLGYWTAAGKSVGLTPVYGIVGAALGLVWGAAGAAFGVVAAGTVAAYEGARQVVYEMLPFLRTAFETAMKVLRRIIPFFFGLLAGLVSGVVGSAAFGALLLARPYFKHVVADDFKHAGALGFLGNVLLKTVALALGIVFGVIGIAAGVLAAAPYALTASVSLAFRFAEIGGPVEKFFDHWTYGALRAEMQRLNQLTDRFQFPEGEAALSDGWIRMANILPATLVGALAATIAGLVGYFRSLAVAYRSAKSGGPIPEPVIDQAASRRWDRTWQSSKDAAASFFWWGIAGAVIGLGIMMMTSWAPLGIAGWLLVAALAGVGVFGALTVGALFAALALLYWIDGQLR